MIEIDLNEQFIIYVVYKGCGNGTFLIRRFGIWIIKKE